MSGEQAKSESKIEAIEGALRRLNVSIDCVSDFLKVIRGEDDSGDKDGPDAADRPLVVLLGDLPGDMLNSKDRLDLILQGYRDTLL